MTRSGIAVLTLVLILALSGTSSGAITTVELSGVPSYAWYEGCGPTAAGMIIGYWDAHGAPNLIPQPKDLQAIRNMIASPEHFIDYVGYGTGMDRLDKYPTVPPLEYHANNSLADFIWGSRGPELADKDSYEYMQVVGLVSYANMRGYAYASGWWEYYGSLWDDFVAEIDAGRPAEFFVASQDKGSGQTQATPDHYVTAIGYKCDDQDPNYRKYEFYDTTGGDAQWKDFLYLDSGKAWSIQSGTFFTAPEPATLVLLAFGCAGLAAGRARKRSTSSAAG